MDGPVINNPKEVCRVPQIEFMCTPWLCSSYQGADFKIFIYEFTTLLSLFARLLSHDPYVEFLEERLCICGDKTKKGGEINLCGIYFPINAAL
jgi:hypothetical protein